MLGKCLVQAKDRLRQVEQIAGAETVETYRDNEPDKTYFPRAMANIEIQSIFVIVKPTQKQ